ncbi:hypothetical protein NL676_018653 [Syzygium grande]|nr:hypothetical protein NL676_018653 [Syzygium grande]
MTAQRELPISGVREGGLLYKKLPLNVTSRSRESQKKMHEVVLLDDPSSLTKKKKSSNEEGRIRVTVVSNKDGQKPLELVVTRPIVVS